MVCGFTFFNKKNILLEKFLTNIGCNGLCSLKNMVYEDVVCMFYANLNPVVIEHEDIVDLLNVLVGDAKLTKVSKEVAYEAIQGHLVEPKSSYLKKKEMPSKFQLLHRIVVQYLM